MNTPRPEKREHKFIVDDISHRKRSAERYIFQTIVPKETRQTLSIIYKVKQYFVVARTIYQKLLGNLLHLFSVYFFFEENIFDVNKI